MILSRNGYPSCDAIKAAASGRWCHILQEVGLPADCLSHRGRPCPLCGGHDRYNAAKNVNHTGAVYCRGCFNGSSVVKPGDGIATVAWLMKTSCGEAAKWLADRLGLTAQAVKPVDIIAATARDKEMPIDAFKQFGVTAEKRGRGDRLVARVDLYDETGKVHSYFDLWPGVKGFCKQGAGNSGMFFPGSLPAPGETWLLVEGVKDAAALVGLGFKAAGLPTNKMASKYARLFTGASVILVPDLDLASDRGAQSTAGNLWGSRGISGSSSIARQSQRKTWG